MRNYPLLKNKNHADTPYNWQKTYVSSLALQAQSLINYSNYFLADYRRGPNPKFLGTRIVNNKEQSCFSIEALRYHQYTDSSEEGLYFLEDDDYLTSNNYRLIRSGRHIINNNQRESNKDTYKDWENIAIQPMGYAAFYLISVVDKKVKFTFTRNAQLYYGNNSPVSILDFYTRFFYKDETGSYNFTDLDYQYKSIDVLSTKNGIGVISDRQGFIWTDLKDNPVMGFTYMEATDGSLGEEFIADTKISYTVKIDKVGVATYTITSNEDLAEGSIIYWPKNSQVYFL